MNEIVYRSDPHIVTNPEGDQRELARAVNTIKAANERRGLVDAPDPVEQALHYIESGEPARKSRDFGRGMAYAAKIIRAAQRGEFPLPEMLVGDASR